MGRLDSHVSFMGLVVAEKVFKEEERSHDVETILSFMISGHLNFPVGFGKTNSSVLLEFIGNSMTLSPGKTLHEMQKRAHSGGFMNVGKQVVQG